MMIFGLRPNVRKSAAGRSCNWRRITTRNGRRRRLWWRCWPAFA